MLNHLQKLGVKVLSAGTVLTLTLFSSALSAQAAEKVVLKYGAFARSVSVEELNTFGETGQATGNLGSLLSIVKSEQRESLRGLLNAQLPFGVVQVDRLLRSPIGSGFLNEMASATILPGGKEVEALRSGVILAAAKDDALKFGTMLEQYPTPTMTVDVRALLRILRTNPAAGAFLNR